MKDVLSGIALTVALAGVAAADVNVGINIGAPPPAIVIPSAPRFVVVPTTPAVRYAPDLDVDVFVYGGRYYTLQDDRWFVAPRCEGPWTYVEGRRLPRAVAVVPSRYYRVHRGHPHGMPPGQAKKLYREAHWDDHHHGHGEGRGHWKHED